MTRIARRERSVSPSRHISRVIFVCAFLLGGLLYMRTPIYQLISSEDVFHANSGVFVKSAFRVDDNEIRFLMVKNIHERRSVSCIDDSGKLHAVEETPISGLRQLFLQCSMEPVLGSVYARKCLTFDGRIRLRSSVDSVPFEVELRDVRPARVYKHALGVCLQPIFYHADWTLLVQFIEFWLSAGATTFYIYVHSATEQIYETLQFYEETLGDSIEIIAWSDLPVPDGYRGNFFTDPNTNLFQVGVHGAINDCVMRAKHSVEFLAMLDLDEMLLVPQGGDLVSRLRRLKSSNPSASAFSAEWLYTSHPKPSTSPKHPSDLRFDHLVDLRVPKRNSVHYAYREFRKIVVMPERVSLVDIHSVLLGEVHESTLDHDGELETVRYEQFDVPSSDLVVLHLRRFSPTVHGISGGALSKPLVNVLNSTAEAMNSAWERRIKTTSKFRGRYMGEWSVTSSNTMATLEHCKYSPYNLRQTIGKGICQAVANCEHLIADRHLFRKTEQVWQNIAQRLKHLPYTEES